VELFDFHGFIEEGFAALLLFTEFGKKLHELALEAGFMALDVAQTLFARFPGDGFDERGSTVRFFDGGDEGGDSIEMAEGKRIGFGFDGAFDAPLRVDDVIGKHVFDGALRAEFASEIGLEFFVRRDVFTGENDELAGEAVANCVEGGGSLTFGGARAGGVFRILLIRCDLRCRWHRLSAFSTSRRKRSWKVGKIVSDSGHTER